MLICAQVAQFTAFLQLPQHKYLLRGANWASGTGLPGVSAARRDVKYGEGLKWWWISASKPTTGTTNAPDTGWNVRAQLTLAENQRSILHTVRNSLRGVTAPDVVHY